MDFGPVRAKLEGREPYLPPELWALFPDRLADSELGEIPEGWEVGISMMLGMRCCRRWLAGEVRMEEINITVRGQKEG